VSPLVSACIAQAIARQRQETNPQIVPRSHFWKAFCSTDTFPSQLGRFAVLPKSYSSILSPSLAVLLGAVAGVLHERGNLHEVHAGHTPSSLCDATTDTRLSHLLDSRTYEQTDSS
jgi:hypothetical protein